MLIHVVQSGETLWQIAAKYHVSVHLLAQLNGLKDPDKLLIGQAIVVPIPGNFHTVQKGESIYSIANQYGISMEQLTQANGLTNPDFIFPGTILYIPPQVHMVQPGETISKIADMYGVSVQSIIRKNRIKDPDTIFPGMSIIIPRPKPVIEVNAYTYQAPKQGVKSLEEHGNLLTYFSPFAYMIKEDGSLEPFDDTAMIEAAQKKDVMPMLAITNFTSTETGSNLAHTILSSVKLSQKVLDNALQVMKAKGYGAINIDFENVLPKDRENYNRFMQMAVDTLHPEGYLVSSALAPKTSANQPGLLYEAHDYEAHGRIADFVVLMTYEWGYRLGPPQAISPINQVKRVIEFASSVMPNDKIFLGFQIYARDWKIPHEKGQEAATFSPQEAIRRATKHGVTIQYDKGSASPFFRYTDESGQGHEVWFEDARSAQAKFDLVNEFNLRGVSYWALGYPFPQNWELLRANFDIRKLM